MMLRCSIISGCVIIKNLSVNARDGGSYGHSIRNFKRVTSGSRF